MAPETIICDWNGTLTGHRNEMPLLSAVGNGLFKASLPFYPWRAARILRGRRELKELQRKPGSLIVRDMVSEMFGVYNKRIARGFPVDMVYRLIDEFAARPDTQEQLDHRVLRPVAECHREGKTTAVFSAGYGYGIRATLKTAGYDTSFSFCKADKVEHDNGRTIGFGLNIYGQKRTYLLDLLRERDIDPGTVAYLGDTDDDAVCFDIVGYPVVPFLAPDEAKERYAREYNAFVPEDEADLLRYLRYA
jgi:phosphoserine phosphatase